MLRARALRTPSLQSPQVEEGSFPWSKVLHGTPARRQLSVIADDESYVEDLFSKSGETVDWCFAPVFRRVMCLLFGHAVPLQAVR